MTELAYQKEVASQMASIGGVLAGLSFAVFIALCSIEKKHRADSLLIPTFLVSSLSLILATALSGMLAFLVPMVEVKKEARAAIDYVGVASNFVWGVGFIALFVGIGLAGYRVSRKTGIVSSLLSLACAGFFAFCLHMLATAFTQQ
jgi:hypothetical protein